MYLVSKTFILVSTDRGKKGTGKAVAKVSEYAPSLQSQQRASRGLKEKKELEKKKKTTVVNQSVTQHVLLNVDFQGDDHKGDDRGGRR